MPAAPVTVDVSLLAGPWPGMQISGITGTGAAALNGYYRQATNTDGVWEYHNVSGNGSKVWAFELPTWSVELTGSNSQFEGDGDAPWLVASWSAVGFATGTPALTRWVPPPVTEEIAGSVETVQATLTTNFTGTNNDLALTAELPGRLGNAISLICSPTALLADPLSVSVSGRDITVHFHEVLEFAGTAFAWLGYCRWHKTLSGSATFTFSNVVNGKTVEIYLSQPGGQAYTVTWPAGITWVAGAPGTIAAGTSIKVTLTATSPSTFNGSYQTGVTPATSSTAAQVKTAMEASQAVMDLLAVAFAAGNDGTGPIVPMAKTFLSGGEGGSPRPPVTVDI